MLTSFAITMSYEAGLETEAQFNQKVVRSFMVLV